MTLKNIGLCPVFLNENRRGGRKGIYILIDLIRPLNRIPFLILISELFQISRGGLIIQTG